MSIYHPERDKVCVIGAGVIGSQLALLTTTAGFQTVLVGRSEASLARAEGELTARFEEMEKAELDLALASGWRSRLVLSNRLEDAAGSAIVMEAISEDADAKSRLFAALDHIASPDCLLLSSTSGLAVDAIAREASQRGRIAVAHFANPPHLMPAVELVPGSQTSATTMDRAEDWIRTLGKIPVRLKQDLPGHLFNRLQYALLREAMALVRDGVAEAADVDAIVKYGLALRLAEEGPIEKMDLAGLDLVSKVATYLFPDLDCSQAPDYINRLLAEGRTGAADGKGFHEWTEKRAEEVIAKRNREVIRHLHRLKADGTLHSHEKPAPGKDRIPEKARHEE